MSLDNTYDFEIDFLPVGDGERSGDAIAMRWLQPDGFYVAVIDGGTLESGAALADHVRTVYGTGRVNLAINTHPDQDHASGLSVVLEQMEVDELWMHRPWAYPHLIRHLFANGQFTTAGLSGRIKSALDCAHTLERIARRKNIPIVEPYQGQTYGPLLVLSPPSAAYFRLIPHFNNTPEARFPQPGLLASIGRVAASGVASLIESWGIETLREDGTTSMQNESSLVIFGRFRGRAVLLTADAGQLALGEAINYAVTRGIDLRQGWIYQVPHHGSRRNVSPHLLNHLLGPICAEGTHPNRYAVASVGAGSTTHPRKAVTNAFVRRGVGVSVTKGVIQNFRIGYSLRPGYQPATLLPLYSLVERYT